MSLINPGDLEMMLKYAWTLSPIGYGMKFDPKFEAPPHLQMLSNAIVDAVWDRGPKRIIVTMPPRHGKSQTVSRWTPVWFLDNWPDKRVMLGSYEATYAATWGKAVRETIREHQDELRVKLSPDTTARAGWDTTEGGYMVSQGVGGSLTGRGAHMLIIDDPIKNAATANSDVARDTLWEWWMSTAYTRLEPGGVAVVVMTRWHEDDLVGRIIGQMEAGGEYWHVIRIPALADESDPLGRAPGEALWPERYTREDMLRIKQSIDEYTWEAMYQQNPTNPGGSIIRRAWFEDNRYHIDDPVMKKSVVARWLSWDTAVKDNDAAAYTVMTVGELTQDYRLILREVYRERLDFPVLLDQMDFYARHFNKDGKLQGIVIEDQASGATAYQTLTMALPDELATLLVPFQPSGSKEQRARQASVWMRNGSVLIPHPDHDKVPWLYDFEQELFGFPTTTYKDQVDSFVQMIQYVEHLLQEGYRARGGYYDDRNPYYPMDTQWSAN